MTIRVLVPYFSLFFVFGFIAVCQNGPRRISLQISLHHTLHSLCEQVLLSISGIHEYEYIVFCVDTFFGHLEVRVSTRALSMHHKADIKTTSTSMYHQVVI